MTAHQVRKQEKRKRNLVRDENAQNVFRYAVRQGLAQVEKLLIEKGKYDRIQMVVDYICEG